MFDDIFLGLLIDIRHEDRREEGQDDQQHQHDADPVSYTHLILADGPDEQDAVNGLVQLIETGFAE